MHFPYQNNVNPSPGVGGISKIELVNYHTNQSEMADKVKETLGLGNTSISGLLVGLWAPRGALCFSSHERFSCLSLNFQLFVSGLFNNSTSITGTLWLSARYLASNKELHLLPCVPFIQLCDSSVAGRQQWKIHSSNQGIPESRRHGSEVAGSWDDEAERGISFSCLLQHCPFVVSFFLPLFFFYSLWGERAGDRDEETHMQRLTGSIWLPNSPSWHFVSDLLFSSYIWKINDHFHPFISLLGTVSLDLWIFTSAKYNKLLGAILP